jgi:hypothetical protein
LIDLYEEVAKGSEEVADRYEELAELSAYLVTGREEVGEVSEDVAALSGQGDRRPWSSRGSDQRRSGLTSAQMWAPRV